MRILIYGINYHPELTGTGKNTGMMAEWLAQRGHQVRAVTAPPFYPEWRVAPDYQSAHYRRELRAGVDVRRCPIWVPRTQSGAKRILHHLSFALTSLPVMLAQIAWRPQLVMCLAPPLLAAPTGWLVARCCRAGAWLNVKDFEVDAAFELGLLRGRGPRRAALAAEGALIGRFDRVSSISTAMVARLVAKGVAADRAVLFPNWVETETIYPDLEARASMRRELQLAPHQTLALYSGNLGAKQGLEVLTEAAARLRDRPDIVFLICGAGGGYGALQAASRDLPAFRVTPLQPAARLNALLNAADLHLLPQKQAAADLVLPGKLLYMLASGRAIIATADPETEVGKLVRAGGGALCASGDAVALAGLIRDWADHPERRAAAGTAARHFAVSQLAKDAVLGRLEKYLEHWLASAADHATMKKFSGS